MSKGHSLGTDYLSGLLVVDRSFQTPRISSFRVHTFKFARFARTSKVCSALRFGHRSCRPLLVRCRDSVSVASDSSDIVSDSSVVASDVDEERARGFLLRRHEERRRKLAITPSPRRRQRVKRWEGEGRPDGEEATSEPGGPRTMVQVR